MNNFIQNRSLIIISLLISLLFLFSSPVFVHAGGIIDKVDKVGKAAQYNVDDPNYSSFSYIAGRFIRILLSLLGVIFLALAVYSGFLWMSARGESEQINKAKGILRNSIIGLIIIAAAYAITWFVIDYIVLEFGQTDVGGR